jgi:hypothetical protein
MRYFNAPRPWLITAASCFLACPRGISGRCGGCSDSPDAGGAGVAGLVGFGLTVPYAWLGGVLVVCFGFVWP